MILNTIRAVWGPTASKTGRDQRSQRSCRSRWNRL